MVRFEPGTVPAGEAVTKMGGQPRWLEDPQWPLSASLGEPMQFIGQFRIDGGGEARLAYVFMTDGDDYVDGTWEPDGGENAVIVQPGGQVPPFVTVRAQAEGPAWPAADHLPVDFVVDAGREPWQFLGGEPRWLQGEETPGPGWRFVAQLTDSFGHNFGDAGIGYVFVSPDGDEGRFLWQCG
ncbi:hypothetical protein [Phytohabitans houttuyneae]|uniref:DUF1963 domain-containing protein n=1 Tax=Phytohabitans houttuyneae TaxID=1076126 RepID=A0A6V8KBJ3_9ACTN|nr:hypothetical protein [Phytohabitans houttuyneae]GFJ82612.1 hypothetical protein Phou_067920 [Phytohabitans houttuyneae]